MFRECRMAGFWLLKIEVGRVSRRSTRILNYRRRASALPAVLRLFVAACRGSSPPSTNLGAGQQDGGIRDRQTGPLGLNSYSILNFTYSVNGKSGPQSEKMTLPSPTCHETSPRDLPHLTTDRASRGLISRQLRWRLGGGIMAAAFPVGGQHERRYAHSERGGTG